MKLKMWWNSKLQTVRKLKNSNGDKTQKLKLLQNSKTQIVTKLKTWREKNSNSKCAKTQIETTQKIKLWHNSKNQIMTKLRNSNCDKTWNMIILRLWRKKLQNNLLVRTFWHFDNQWDVLLAAFCNSRDVLLLNGFLYKWNFLWKLLYS